MMTRELCKPRGEAAWQHDSHEQKTKSVKTTTFPDTYQTGSRPSNTMKLGKRRDTGLHMNLYLALP